MKNKLFPMEKNDEASMGPGCVQARNEGLTRGQKVRPGLRRRQIPALCCTLIRPGSPSASVS